MPDFAMNQKAYAETTDVHVSPFVMAANAFDVAAQVSIRVQVLADRLLGPTPQAVGNASGMSAPSALLPQLRSSADLLNDQMREAMEALSRIERALP